MKAEREAKLREMADLLIRHGGDEHGQRMGAFIEEVFALVDSLRAERDEARAALVAMPKTLREWVVEVCDDVVGYVGTSRLEPGDSIATLVSGAITRVGPPPRALFVCPTCPPLTSPASSARALREAADEALKNTTEGGWQDTACPLAGDDAHAAATWLRGLADDAEKESR